MADSIRWHLYKFDEIDSKIIVIDQLFKREKSYHVPNLIHAIIKNSALYVTTSNNKVMRVCLFNGSRKMVGIEDYKNLDLYTLNSCKFS
jgi:hypothetical protein